MTQLVKITQMIKGQIAIKSGLVDLLCIRFVHLLVLHEEGNNISVV